MQSIIGNDFIPFLLKDITGRNISLEMFSERKYKIVGFANRKTGARMNEIILECFKLYNKEFSFIQMMDLVGVPPLIRKLPEAALKNEYEKMSQKVLELIHNNSLTVTIDNVKDSFFMIPDWKGEVVSKYFDNDKMKIDTQLLIVNKKNIVLNHFINWNENDLEVMEGVLNKLIN